MRKSNITANFKSDIDSVWNIVTDNENYAWRSDLSKVEIIDSNKFIEYTKEGYQTQFHITAKETNKRYEFDMANKNFSGHWVGIFTELECGGTKIDFTEELKINNSVMEILSYLFMNLKKIQEQYIIDLRKALKES
ncbi:MAG: SRPBCC family protein [Bacillota bacterium]